jgi:hypothetical protein
VRISVAAAVLALLAAPAAADQPPWLGITYHPDPDGAFVTEVHPGSAAATAGLRRDDVIEQIGGRTVGTDLGAAIGSFHVGDRAPIVIHRGGRRLRLVVRLRARPTPDEMIHQRLVGYDLPDVALDARAGGEVAADDWHGRPLVIALYDARCEACASAVTALADGFRAAGGPLADAPVEAWVLSAPEELRAYLALVPLPVPARRVDRDLGTPLLGGLTLEREGAIVVVDAGGTIRYAASTTSGELAADGAGRVAARVIADWRAGR